jgi:hypothetical protein
VVAKDLGEERGVGRDRGRNSGEGVLQDQPDSGSWVKKSYVVRREDGLVALGEGREERSTVGGVGDRRSDADKRGKTGTTGQSGSANRWKCLKRT